ncbi:MAG: sugar ABC transporter permease [Clostridia bacterium]|nr:sugar ABC transporter permease [Clostridia bacterium]
MTKAKKHGGQGKRTEAFKSWLIMLPGLVLMTFFVWEPLLESVRMSLYKTENVELVEFVGLKNFISVMGKTNFTHALVNTFSYTFWSLLIGFLLPISLAMLIGETVRGKGFFRTAAYLPNMLPGLAVIILWSAFFSGGKSGVLNILLGKLGIPSQTYLTEANLVIPIIITVATWKGAGTTALIYMAAMASVNTELYEAATIDGANVWQRVIHILLPSIKKLAGTLLILQIISVFQIMYEPMVLTKGGPDNASLSLMQLMWQYAFGGSMDYGKASAVAVIVTVILLLMTAVYSYFNRKESDWD